MKEKNASSNAGISILLQHLAWISPCFNLLNTENQMRLAAPLWCKQPIYAYFAPHVIGHLGNVKPSLRPYLSWVEVVTTHPNVSGEILLPQHVLQVSVFHVLQDKVRLWLTGEFPETCNAFIKVNFSSFRGCSRVSWDFSGNQVYSIYNQVKAITPKKKKDKTSNSTIYEVLGSHEQRHGLAKNEGRQCP